MKVTVAMCFLFHTIENEFGCSVRREASVSIADFGFGLLLGENVSKSQQDESDWVLGLALSTWHVIQSNDVRTQPSAFACARYARSSSMWTLDANHNIDLEAYIRTIVEYNSKLARNKQIPYNRFDSLFPIRFVAGCVVLGPSSPREFLSFASEIKIN